ncbi:AMP-binding protein [Emcibacter sp.]|uniref:AMP-binding protein n=1 Tax=Emcibacter sp. TaxID=1979954 RepID=UPI002AA7A94D|nr:AMP-binding protein [Emcibacter sp.]
MDIKFENRTVHGVIEQLSRERGEDTFLFFEEESWTYGEINAAANRVAAGLAGLGLGRNDKVAIMMTNRPEFLFSWFGLCKLGAVEVPVNTAHKGQLLSYMINQSDCEAIILEACFAERLHPVLGDLETVKHIIVLDGPVNDLGGQVHDYGRLMDNDGTFEAPIVRPSDPCAMMFTSGTTGPSKGAVVPHNYQLVMAEIICGMGEYTAEDRLYNALPLFHGNAQTLSTMPALISGASMVLKNRFSASSFWDDVRKYGCTEFNYIGGILAILLKAEPGPDDADNPLRVLVGAGANKQVFEEFERRFDVKLVEGYGMSEIGAPLNTSIRDRRPGSCGTVNPGYQVKLVDDDGHEVRPNEPGELLIRPLNSHAMMLEYYRMPEKTVEAWQDLWFHTGDYLQRDEDGYYYFVDRKKDALRRRGENISSFEVERTINSHEKVLESAAIAARSELGEDEVMVCVVLRPGESLTAAELISFCEDQMAYFMVPRYVRFMDSLPKTPTERVQKFRLRDEGVTADTFDREQGDAT